MSTNNIFSKDGVISQYFTGYEHRPQQTEMYETISGALAVQGRAHVVIEAGTGVGKTFAYLIPLIQHSIATGKPVVVSTNTINLQEQIAYKDITFLKTLPIWGENDFEVALGKGRSNYLCLRRLNNAQLHQTGLFEELSEVKELKEINKWSYELLKTKGDGSLSALSFVPQNSVWSKVCSEYDNCPGRHCAYYNKCFYQRARQKLWSANLIVVNHPLLVIDAMLRKDKANILPPYEALVIDEAHRLEGVAQDHLGLEISNGRINYLLNNLYNPRNERGFLKFLPAQVKPNQVKDIVVSLRETAERFFGEVIQWSSTKAPANGRVKKPNFDGTITNPLSEALMGLYIALGELKKRTGLSRAQGASGKTPSAKIKKSKKSSAESDSKEGYDGFELDAYIRRTLGLATEIDTFFKQTLSSTGNDNRAVYWVEIKDRRRGQPSVFLKSAPIKVDKLLKDLLFDRIKIAVLTSATMATSTANGLKYIKETVGLDNTRDLVLGSPFDYHKQVKLYITKNTPDPRTDKFEEAAGNKILKYLDITKGRAFVLFTSYNLMNKIHQRLAPQLEQMGIPVYIQGRDLPRHQMLEQFKNRIGSVIFGADSFWQGVDVPGEALENIIITKLPFPVPSEPIVEAKIEDMERHGIDSFQNYFIPEAALKLRQGFGRLIRTKTDKGIVVILDSRVLNKGYGKSFLDALPKCQIIIED